MLQRFDAFSSAISGIYHAIQKVERDEMVKYGLKGPYAQYLLTIARCPQGITAARLGQVYDKAAVSRAITEMEQRGLVTRDCVNTPRAIIGSVIGTHAGPGAIAAACFRKG